jgi:hypothetical protein
MKWRIPSWVSLDQSCSGNHQYHPMNGGGANTTRGIDHIVWDMMGVLLAVICNKSIRIYDWDMVRAADIQGRRDRVRNCHKSEWKIQPIISFQLPNPVSSLLWNPYNVDKLAVGFRVSGQVRIYNVDCVAQWLSRDA